MQLKIPPMEIRLCYIVNSVTADEVATQGARISTAKVFTQLFRNVPVLALEGLIYFDMFHI